MKLHEEVSEDGQYLYVYSSSKDKELFKYYFGRDLRFGTNAGSAYGFGTYAILTPPFNEGAEVGYSDAVRDNLYGQNCFEFKISTSKVVFFEFADYQKVNPQAQIDTFIKEQLDRLGVHLNEQDLNFLTPLEGETFSSRQASAFYKYMSHIYYQSKDGRLITPCAGFIYKGRQDGRTYVGWSPYELQPTRFTNDNGATWAECDRSTPEYREYMEGYTDEIDDPFNGKKTPKKEAIYRLFQKYSSNDDGSTGMSGGIFSQIRINDDHTIDAKFTSNLPQVDSYRQFFWVNDDNRLLHALKRLGYRIGKLNCGIKIGPEEGLNPVGISSIDPSFFPKEVTGTIRIGYCVLNKEELSHLPTKADAPLYIVHDLIEDDCLLGRKIEVSEKKACYCSGQEDYDRLSSIYGDQEWWSTVKPEPPAPKKKRVLKDPAKQAAAEKERAEKAKAKAEGRARALKNWDDDVAKVEGLTEAMKGKSHLKHLFNDGHEEINKGDFANLVGVIEDAGGMFSPEDFTLSEKIDGSTVLFGVDGQGLFLEKFGQKDVYRLSDQGKELPNRVSEFLHVLDNPVLEQTLNKIKGDRPFIKVQCEMLVSAVSKSKDNITIQLIPYRRDAFPEEGAAFVVRVMDDKLESLPNQNAVIEEVCRAMNTSSFMVKPMSSNTIDFEPIDVSDWVEEVKNGMPAAEAKQKLQSTLTEHIPTSRYGEYYEGIVVNCPAIGLSFKMTSDKFKALFASHNQKPTDADLSVEGEPYGIVEKTFNGKQMLLNHIGPGTELVGILLGHFAPFTGPNGHGRMIKEFQDKGCSKFVILIPRSKADFDDDRAMYDTDQRVEIAQAYLDSEGIDGIAMAVNTSGPDHMIGKAVKAAYDKWGAAIRPVLVIGPDRRDDFKNVEFGTDPSTTRPEKYVLTDRGEGNVSGTKVRELIRKSDVGGIVEMTGYSEGVARKLVDLRNKNAERAGM